MFILDPDFYPSRIPDLGSRTPKQQQRRVKKKFAVIPFSPGVKNALDPGSGTATLEKQIM
jgi:hypothetical protein